MIRLSKEEIENAPDFMPIKGHEGLYEVGKDGTVWSLNYRRSGQRKQLVPAPSDKYGHLKVSLWKDGKVKKCPVHQLVLNAYLPKPFEYLEVLHINSEPKDNRLQNLSWGTHEENMNDAHFRALLSKPVLREETGEQYPSVHEASRQTGIDHSDICKCLNGKLKTAGGYHWRKMIKEC